MSICLYAYMFRCLYVYMSICLYVYMSICLYVYMSICLYVYMSICIYVQMSICLYVYMFRFGFGFGFGRKIDTTCHALWCQSHGNVGLYIIPSLAITTDICHFTSVSTLYLRGIRYCYVCSSIVIFVVLLGLYKLRL